MYRKFFNILTLLLMAVLPHFQAEAQTFPYQDTNLSIEERVEDLLSRLTLDEKLSLMEHHNPAIPSLDLPAYSWWNEALHGVGRNGLATVWPMPIALGATFNPQLVQNIFAEVAIEAVMKSSAQLLVPQESATLDTFTPQDYTGLTFFTPNINIVRDPRWGRGMETFGEDPCLTAQMGLACVNGLQHCYDDEEMYGTRLWTAACLKHLAVHSGPEGTRHQFDSHVSPRDLWSTYLPAFEYIIRHSDVQQVMCAYNRLNGEPCCTNRDLLVDILRHKWHYDNMLVTDCWALNDCWERDTVIPRHETHASATAAAADAFGSEVDLECGSGLEALRQAVSQYLVSERKVNEHVRRILRTRLKVMGWATEMELPEADINPHDAATESFVLLKNKGLLPLKAGTKVYLAGPNAMDTLMPLGNYNGTPKHTISVREGLAEVFTLVDNPSKADVIVYAGGLSPQLEGEELPVDEPGFLKGDRTSIELPKAQSDELAQLRRKHKPVVLLLCTGSALALDKTALKSEAIMVCWYGGQDMGSAVASALEGSSDNFGRLPITFYKSTQQLPAFENYDMQGRTYRYMDEKPLYPFGFGLNYVHFQLDSLEVDKDNLTVNGVVSAHRDKKDVKHKFTHKGQADRHWAVVQVYCTNMDDPQGPKQSLVGFAKVPVTENQPCHFSIKIDPYWLRVFDEDIQEMSEFESKDNLSFNIVVNN